MVDKMDMREWEDRMIDLEISLISDRVFMDYPDVYDEMVNAILKKYRGNAARASYGKKPYGKKGS